MLYSELQCSEAIHKAVERMGFAEMTEIQEKTIPVMLAGRDVIAKAPTGTGKTCPLHGLVDGFTALQLTVKHV